MWAFSLHSGHRLCLIILTSLPFVLTKITAENSWHGGLLVTILAKIRKHYWHQCLRLFASLRLFAYLSPTVKGDTQTDPKPRVRLKIRKQTQTLVSVMLKSSNRVCDKWKSQRTIVYVAFVHGDWRGLVRLFASYLENFFSFNFW